MVMIKKQILFLKFFNKYLFINFNIMIKKIFFFSVLLSFSINTQAQDIINSILKSSNLSQNEIGNGLKEALDHGIKNQVSKLTSKDGFYKNELVKIAFPKELRAVEKGLRRAGLGNLADEGVKVLNRAAEDAVKTATPIFIDAVKNISFSDAKNILLGDENAATSYLKTKTSTDLFASFSPVIEKSFNKVGADKVWSGIISKYNGLPFVKKVNPDLTKYVTDEALTGVFTMIGEEEKGIREKVGLRDTSLLKEVFSMQDKN